ncbi:MAG: class I SAM-dependent methyltransferase [Promethearchaeota archaeon]
MPRIEPFEKYPFKYEQWFNDNKWAYKSELLAIKKQLPESENGIEIGVGSGRFSAPLGIKIGVEPSSKMRMLSKKKMIALIDSIAECLPFRSSIFNFVLMVTTICFVDDIEITFKEVFRILKQGGTFIIGFIDRNSEIGKLYEQHKKSSVFYSMADFYSVNEVVSYLKKAKFKHFSFSQTIFHPLSSIKNIEKVKNGYGNGSFVVIKALKKK